MREEDEVKRVVYPYIPASWLSIKVGEWEEGKKRTPLGWMSDLERENTGMFLWPTEKVGEVLPPLPVGVVGETAGSTGSRIKATLSFATWERAKDRLKKQGF